MLSTKQGNHSVFFFLLPLGFFEQMKINFPPLINSVFEQVQIWKLSNSLMVQFLNNILVLDVFQMSVVISKIQRQLVSRALYQLILW